MISHLSKPDKYRHLVVEHSLLLPQGWLQRFHFFANGQTRFTTNIFNAWVASEEGRFIQLRAWAAPRAASFSKARLHSHIRVVHRLSTLHFGMFSFDRICFFRNYSPGSGQYWWKHSVSSKYPTKGNQLQEMLEFRVFRKISIWLINNIRLVSQFSSRTSSTKILEYLTEVSTLLQTIHSCRAPFQPASQKDWP